MRQAFSNAEAAEISLIHASGGIASLPGRTGIADGVEYRSFRAGRCPLDVRNYRYACTGGDTP
jgi:hypothetical protein